MQPDVIRQWLKETFADLWAEVRWSYAPPLMVYLAAGLQGLSAIVGTFFVKDYLSLSAAFIAGLAFWAGLPWALKMPIGHLVDLIWRWKALLVYFGASLISASLLIMYGLIAHTEAMRQTMSAEAWFVLATLLAPIGYVIQDVVADAMTVEAVPVVDAEGNPLPEDRIKAQHTTMQMLGRFAIISGLVIVALLNITMFQGVAALTEAQKADIYANIYLMALVVPAISAAGVVLNDFQLAHRRRTLLAAGVDPSKIDALLSTPPEDSKPNWWIFGGTGAFAVFTITMGLADIAFAQEIIFVGSASIIIFLMSRLLNELEPEKARMLVGTAIILFVFRATPLPGPGLTWFEIDILRFDQQFLAVLSLITAVLALAGMVLLRPLMAKKSIAYIVVALTIAAGVLALPNIGLYYGVHEVTSRWTGGIVDARFIAIIDTAIESPLGQIAMIPLLAWIARNAPAHLKATFFAVMASFVNLALSASSLLTKHLNNAFVITREVKDNATGTVAVPADYGSLGMLLIVVALLAVLAPLIAVWLVQRSRFNTTE
ncbi:MAG: hypothetical protein RLZ98_2846 [Pseudomonadota bacterium]|jgi:hypothetical protein